MACLQFVSDQMNIIYSLMEVIILREAEGVNKSPHLESAMFAHSMTSFTQPGGTACWAKGEGK